MSAPTSGRTAAEQLHHEQLWNTIALCSLLVVMGLTTAGALVAAITQHPSRSLQITLGFLAVVVAASFVVLIAYFIRNPLYETKQEAARAKNAKARPRR